jgi:hypothetical protein
LFNSITDSASCDCASRFHLESGFGDLRGRSSRKFESATHEYGQSTVQKSKHHLSIPDETHSKHHFTKFNRSFAIRPAKLVQPYSLTALQPYSLSLSLSSSIAALWRHSSQCKKLLDLSWAVNRPYSWFVFG